MQSTNQSLEEISKEIAKTANDTIKAFTEIKNELESFNKKNIQRITSSINDLTDKEFKIIEETINVFAVLQGKVTETSPVLLKKKVATTPAKAKKKASITKKSTKKVAPAKKVATKKKVSVPTAKPKAKSVAVKPAIKIVPDAKTSTSPADAEALKLKLSEALRQKASKEAS